MAGAVQAAYDVLMPPGGPAVGVLVHVPHGALAIPPTERGRLLVTDAELAQELLLMTDRHTPELVAGSVELGGTVLVNRLSRLVVDFHADRFLHAGRPPAATPVGRAVGHAGVCLAPRLHAHWLPRRCRVSGR